MSTDPSLLGEAIAQLIERRGRMAELGSEGGSTKLDWVDAVPRLLDHPSWLEGVEAEAAEIVGQGIRHIIWAGMGGSVMAVGVLAGIGAFAGARVTIYPLDSTDPAALNRIVARLAAGAGTEWGPTLGAETLRKLLGNVLMVGVAMGMTSEEPITHLQWFAALLDRAQLPPAKHLRVMALPGSYLERFAQEHAVPLIPLQPDGGTGTPGRMSAPGTRVFLLPAALALVGRHPRGTLRATLERAWSTYDLAAARRAPETHLAVQWAIALSEASVQGTCRLLLSLPPEWRPLLPWVEQLMEESLGKQGKGVMVFEDQPLSTHGIAHRAGGTMRLTPKLGPVRPDDTESLLVATATIFLRFQLTMALYGYLHDLPFAGQPAVEDYKARARRLRELGDPLAVLAGSPSVQSDGLTVYLPRGIAAASPAAAIAVELRRVASEGDGLLYLDVTCNGEMPQNWEPAMQAARMLAHERIGVPLKLRRAPAAYHSTEQSEMDGPPGVVSLRILTRRHEPAGLGEYSDTFLIAQAVGTWQAMTEAGRSCFLIVAEGGGDDAAQPLRRLFERLAVETKR